MKLKRKKALVNIPLNAMSDVAFLLLIFIMLVSLINYRKSVPIEYPQAEKIGNVSGEENLEIWIDKDGAVYLNGEAATSDKVENAVAEIYRTAPATRVHVIADKNTEFKDVDKIIQILQILEYRVVSFVAKEAAQ